MEWEKEAMNDMNDAKISSNMLESGQHSLILGR